MSSHQGLKGKPLAVAKAKAILVGAVFENTAFEDEAPLAELSRLVKTAGGEEVLQVVQKLRTPNPAYYIGKGKVEEIAMLREAYEANVVIFNSDLSAAQARNLEKAIGCSIIERSELILGIFARHASTRAAKLQVEVARLRYTLPRLKRMWTHLERQTGGIGMRAGAGERQIETDRRKVRTRIADLERELKEIESHRKRVVNSRDGHFTVSLVGYTNAGKSTLMRALTGEDVLIEDKLFATLDTKTGAMTPDRSPGLSPPAGVRVLISDTVGFIRDIPHGLIASFHATLEEARNADLLLHVVDCSDPNFEDYIKVVDDTLEEIGANELPTLMVLNKIDCLKDKSALGHIAERHGNAYTLSAVTGEGVDPLRKTIVSKASRGAEAVKLRLPASDQAAIRYMHNHVFNIVCEYFEDSTVEVAGNLRKGDLKKLRRDFPTVEVIES